MIGLYLLTRRDRVPNEAEALPEMLITPLAIADDLLDPAAMKPAALDNQESKPVEGADADPESNGEPARTVRIPHVINSSC